MSLPAQQILAALFTLAGAVATLLFGARPAPAQEPLWPEAPWRAFVTGSLEQGFMPISLAAGDMDGDGDPDVLVGHFFFGSPGISVLENRGDGTYLAPAYYALAMDRTVGEVALADFDADGDRDAFATIPGANGEEATLLVWRNNGDATLAPPVEFATGGEHPLGMVVGDFTGDGKPDVVIANYGFNARSVSLLRHNGQAGAGAGFLPGTHISLGMRVEKVAAGDVDGDGHLDLAVSGFQDDENEISYILILVNDGSGGFGAPAAYEAAPGENANALRPHTVALRDLDNDSDTDLIAGGYYEPFGAITIRRNGGQGSFGAHEAYPMGDFFAPPWSLATADLDGDGFADVVAATPSARAIDGFVVLPSNGTGSFGVPAYYEAEQMTYAVAAFDADGDGDADVATVAQYSAAMTVHLNPGSGSFPVLTRYAVGGLSDGVESADIDNDGDVDIVTNGEFDIVTGEAVIVVLKNDGDGTFVLAAYYVYPRELNFADTKLRELNGDGFVDLLLGPDGNFPPYHFATALNNGDGTFAPLVVTPVFSCGYGSIDAFDLDGDGDRDVVLTEEEGCAGGTDPHIYVFHNDGNQVFVLAALVETGGHFARGIEGADLIEDGRLDLVTALGTGMGVFPNNGGFSFGTPVVSETSYPYKFRLADFDGDGKLDSGMVLSQERVYEVDVATALGLGGGRFGPARVQRGSNTAESLRISDDLDATDFDGDGDVDLLTFNCASNDISLFLNGGDGILLPQQRYGIGYSPGRGTVADFNGDGRPDVAAAIGLPPSGVGEAIVLLRSAASSALFADGFETGDTGNWSQSVP